MPATVVLATTFPQCLTEERVDQLNESLRLFGMHTVTVVVPLHVTTAIQKIVRAGRLNVLQGTTEIWIRLYQ